MKVLVACEFSGTVRDAFNARGHDAWSCDLLESERGGKHVHGDVIDLLKDGWDFMQRYSLAADAVTITARPVANPDGTLYMAAEVDARIAELEKVIRAIANMDQADLSIADKYESCLYAARSVVLSLAPPTSPP